MSSPELILASGSPRRRELLTAAGYRFRVVKPRDGAEPDGACSSCGPAQLVVDLASAKLSDVLDQLRSNDQATEPETPQLVLAADTVAEVHGQILGKPKTDDHAAGMMRLLSAREHRVYSGIALARRDAGLIEHLALEPQVTTLRMDTLSADWIERYVDSGAWEGKAGGFGYQDGLGFVHVTEGSESNVVGLPMERVKELLQRHGCVPATCETEPS
ncbi:MAG: nucleoside triphosphate pyrophosphatase [Planctomycetota bacterium]